MYTPTYWKVLKITSGDKTTYKLLAHWLGGFAEDDLWRLNSGIVDVQLNDTANAYEVYGYSGSVYNCAATAEHMSGFMIGIVDSFMYRLKDELATIEPISMEDYLNEIGNCK